MTKEDNRKERRSWWMQFLISVIGTAIGVGLTFAVSNRLENRKKEQAQRLTAMMVIHDIDESIDRVKSMKDDMEQQYDATIYAMSHLDQMESLSFDTLVLALTYIVADDEAFSFDTSKEKIFHSSPDTWQNLGSMKFIDNVQSFYFNRQSFLETYNKSVYWKRPISTREFEEISVYDESLSIEQYQDLYYSKLRVFLKEKLAETSVQHYINYAAWRMLEITNMIGEWIKINNENKFLMSITDEELEAYVNSINKTGIALKEDNLIGTWNLSSTDDQNADMEFRKDHTFTIVSNQSATTNMPFAKGKLKISYSVEGIWALEGDSLIQTVDWDTYYPEADASELMALPGRQDMLDSWLKEYSESLLDFKRNNPGRKERIAYGACLDVSRDKMELKSMTLDEKGEMKLNVAYMKRKK